jgi:exodeoxyribonuclease V alpha subunit
MPLDSDQQRAVSLAESSRLLIITGGPGVGKTHTIKTIIDNLLNQGKVVSLAAPTGKAAKRMKQATGHDAKTIHRLLQFNPMAGFGRNRQNPIEADTIIIDESSMIDIELMASLMDAVAANTQLIFVGDVDQLPSVGPGYVLADMIRSDKIPTAWLRTVHRQEAGSLIHLNAQKINQGDVNLEYEPIPGAYQSFWRVNINDAENIPGMIVQCIERIPKNAEFRKKDGSRFKLSDIQVLTPQKKGVIGSEALNVLLRNESFNPDGQKLSGINLRKNDRVIQLRNDYELEIFNGDIGYVVGNGDDRSEIKINFEGYDNGDYLVGYPVADIDSLNLAYALTIHKSQGSEYPCVIIPVHTTNWVMLKRQLIYTAITRGKELVVLVGSKKALDMAINTAKDVQRNTGLCGRIS